ACDAAIAPSAAPLPAQDEPPEDDALLDRSMLGELCEEIGEEAARAILDVFLKETRERLALLETLSGGTDRGAIEVEAHTLKGAAGSVGFARVSALAKTLEFAARAGATTDYAAEIARIRAAFVDSCRQIDERPLPGAARAA